MNNKKISKQTIGTIKFYVSNDSAVQLSNKLHSLQDSHITITNTGVVSSGKSSLFNALLYKNPGDSERFPVGAARTTTIKDIADYTDNIELVDTPGIDVKDEDDKAALDAICASSIIVMVHNIKTGMLQQNEVDWLEKIANNFNYDKQQIKNRFIFVNTWIETRMNENSYQHTLDETQRILFSTLGTSVDVINVSAKLYMKGIKENKKKLVEISNFLSLKEIITNKAVFYSEHYGSSFVKKEVTELCKNVCDSLRRIKGIKYSIKKETTQEVRERFDMKREQWKEALDKFESLSEEYDDIISELEE